jgi:hypothetical protein
MVHHAAEVAEIYAAHVLVRRQNEGAAHVCALEIHFGNCEGDQANDERQYANRG